MNTEYYQLNETHDKIIYINVNEDDDMITNEMIKNNKIVYSKKLCLGLLPEDIIQKIYRQIYKYVIYPINEIKILNLGIYSAWVYDLQLAPNMSLQTRIAIEHSKKRIIELTNIIENTEIEDYDDGTADYLRTLSNRHDHGRFIDEKMEWVNERYQNRVRCVLKETDHPIDEANGIEIMDSQLSTKSIRALKWRCKMNGLKKYSKLKRNELIKLLMSI
tara:strand:- start:235 stop:888 length:654 start_codon:yes stop_codon:yes gene_type:complete